MVGFDGIVRVLLDDMKCHWNKVVEHLRVGGCPVGRHLRPVMPDGESTIEECPSSKQIPPIGQVDVDDLAVLVDGYSTSTGRRP